MGLLPRPGRFLPAVAAAALTLRRGFASARGMWKSLRVCCCRAGPGVRRSSVYASLSQSANSRRRMTRDPTRAMAAEICRPNLQDTKGVGERSGNGAATDMTVTERCGKRLPLCSTFRSAVRGDREARTLISPTPSIVDRDRRCRSAIAMRSPLLDSRRPV